MPHQPWCYGSGFVAHNPHMGQSLWQPFWESCDELKLIPRAQPNPAELTAMRRENDTFVPFRDIWDMFNQSLRIPGPFITVDEQHVLWRGRCKFLQYNMPSKSRKYELKIFQSADADSFYHLQGIPYLGKKGREPQKNLGRNIATTLCYPFLKSGRNHDYSFTAKGLSKNNMTPVGTVRRNKRLHPPQFINPNIDKYKTVFAFQKKDTLVSYKSERKKKCVLYTPIVDDSREKVPEIVSFYKVTKGGVDVMNKLTTALRVTKRWPMRLFLNKLDVANIAVLVVFRYSKPENVTAHKDNKKKISPRIFARTKPKLSSQYAERLNDLSLNCYQDVRNRTVNVSSLFQAPTEAQ